MPECTAAAVTEFLTDAGLPISEPAGEFERTDGLRVQDVPETRGRVTITFWPLLEAPLVTLVERSIEMLCAAGYQVERVMFWGGYLAVWTEGPF